MGDFRRLRVWQHSQQLARTVYVLTDAMPARERYGITAQMRRAAMSVSSNLAEGCGRRSDRELRRFIRISLGSLAELECQALLARDLAMLTDTPAEELVARIHRVGAMLERLHTRLAGAARPKPLDP
jgi:four helix bundle protein